MLYITPNSIVYKVVKPVAFPCFGVLKKEKHILLPSIVDIVIEQGYIDMDVFVSRIVGRCTQVVLTHLANLKRATVLTSHGSPSRTPRTGNVPSSGELILQKLEEVGSSVKRVENIIEEQKHPKSQPVK
ncbi:uncharacterized protein LOC113337006 isoform X2 [Papaver somniferum]|uniref:uncharacterized protein LOC113337006 isoform X2 n=1 Tax=Papaver somniferum TaxID=3469 RepID=UPI000E704F73|nr:uncharacterized protein LOC113337006 isoform X2 [Papaver somniferum]